MAYKKVDILKKKPNQIGYPVWLTRLVPTARLSSLEDAATTQPCSTCSGKIKTKMAQAHEHRLTRLLMRAETLVYAGCYSIYTALIRLKRLRQCVYHVRSEI